MNSHRSPARTLRAQTTPSAAARRRYPRWAYATDASPVEIRLIPPVRRASAVARKLAVASGSLRPVTATRIRQAVSNPVISPYQASPLGAGAARWCSDGSERGRPEEERGGGDPPSGGRGSGPGSGP